MEGVAEDSVYRYLGMCMLVERPYSISEGLWYVECLEHFLEVVMAYFIVCFFLIECDDRSVYFHDFCVVNYHARESCVVKDGSIGDKSHLVFMDELGYWLHKLECKHFGE